MSLLALASLGALLASGPALAQEQGSYVGLGVGQSSAKLNDAAMASSVLGSGFGISALERDRRDTGYKLFGGWQFNRYLALEAGYFRLGEFSSVASTVPSGGLNTHIKMQGVNLDLVATLPITDSLSALGRVGGTYARNRAEFVGSGAASGINHEQRARGSNAKYGAGLQYAFSPSFLVRGEVERYRMNDTTGGHGNVDLVSVSLVFPLGRSSNYSAPRAAAPQPVYVAQAPAPAPAPAPVLAPAPMVMAPMAPPPPPPPAVKRVSFTAESLFGFDRSTVRPEGQAALDNFSRELTGSSYQVINVEGHTDRLGTEAYNQHLSEQRAEAVKRYLVDGGKLDGSKIAAVGKGESQPLTKPEDCKGNKQSAALIACLQPDRRVEIEVVGTR
ncbi:OmpA family protein [Paucibacter soli]|uniref:OmpA family protein n=1 Tax=Paucibacter soli TaxID=3133433 RepID=UPI0030AF5456